METLSTPSQTLYEELMRRAQQNRELMRILKISEEAWSITVAYEKAHKAMKPTSKARAIYSNRSK